MNTLLRMLLLTGVLFCSSQAMAEWRSILADSALDYSIQFEGQDVAGRFDQFQVRTDFNPDQPAAAQLKVVVTINSADMDDADINAEIAAPSWFDALLHPQATFCSQRIELREGKFVATGALELKGIQRTVEVPFTWTATDTKAVMTGELVLDRSHFNIGTGEWVSNEVIGYPVEVSFRVALEQ